MTPTPVAASTLPLFGNMRTQCAECGNRGDILVAYHPACPDVDGEHFHRRCMKCGHRWPEQTTERARPLTTRVLGHDVELTCVCGFTLTQPLRDAIADECPRCRRGWRR